MIENALWIQDMPLAKCLKPALNLCGFVLVSGKNNVSGILSIGFSGEIGIKVCTIIAQDDLTDGLQG